MAITDWPEDERPREKLLRHGPATLSDAELLAIFLRTGVAGKSAVDLARELLAGFGGLRPLLNASRTDFCAGQGLGDAKYAQLQAVLEMARRHLREVFLALFLDTRHRLIAAEELFLGTLGEAVVHPREVVRRAMHHNASALIVAHNHPSGVAEPSRADEVVTLRLKEALGMVDVRLLDHFVVGDGETVSLAERGLL
ncbi:MAG TPA: JAB domain-containing protein [Chromatiales bacterium]|nr:JAB domain-containing protein [Chromatiales bacterium]